MLSAIILTAGKSQRMGQPKAFLPFSQQESFIQHILSVYSSISLSKIVVVCNTELEEKIVDICHTFKSNTDIKVVVNEHPETGRFGSIQKGLAELNSNSAAFIQNIDNPFIKADLLESMSACLKTAYFVLPIYKGVKGHPVLLSSEIVNRIRYNENDDCNLRDLLNEYSCIELNTQEPGIHHNINTIEQYQKYFEQELV